MSQTPATVAEVHPARDARPDRLFRLCNADPGTLRGRAWGVVERLLGIDQLNGTYSRCAGAGDVRAFLQRCLDDIGVRFRVSQEDLDRVPRKGPLVVVSNHPFGALDGIILASLLKSIRPDVKVMANYLLGRIPDLRDLFVFVDPFGSDAATSSNRTPIREALRQLADGGVLAAFPAGEVSHLRRRDLLNVRQLSRGGWRIRNRFAAEPQWNTTIARIAGKANVPVLPVYFSGQNSTLFQLAGLVHPMLRTALLAREFFNKRDACIDVRIGSVIPVKRLATLPSDEAAAEYTRGRTFLLRHTGRKGADPTDAHRKLLGIPLPIRKPVPAPAMEPIVEPVAPELLVADVAALPPEALLVTQDDLQVYLARAPKIRHLLREIGRLREVTFRAAGEGSGKACDLDTFDYDYQHLFVWNKAKNEIVGAYRLGATDELLPAKGRLGLYTSTLFNFKRRLLDQINPAMEMGRSFVRAEYQKSYAPLLMLWKGIGQTLVRNPRYRYLIGPVSISNSYQTVSRQVMVEFLNLHHAMPGAEGLARPRHPFRARRPRGWDPAVTKTLQLEGEDVSDLVSDLEPDAKGIPVLLRQYLRLGAKFLSFNVDPDFADALDGLIVVDLLATEERVLEKYFTKQGLASYLAHHRKPRPARLPEAAVPR